MKHILILLLAISTTCFGQDNPLKGFKKSSVELGKKTFDMYEGTIPVRLNHDDTSSVIIDLPVRIIKSSSSTPAKPIYGLTGGPGISNFSNWPSGYFLANHDFVTVGYRGADGVVMKKSKKIKKATKGLHNQLLSDESLDNLGQVVDDYFSGLSKEGIHVEDFTIIDVIDDMEEVRKQLGHDKINLYSGSYGTRVALLYSYRYPGTIYRSFMYGINPPGHCIWYPEMTNRIIQRYDSIYKAQYDTVEISIEESIRMAFKHMPKRWTFFRLDPDKIKAATFVMLFSKENAIMVFDSYKRAALKGDYSGLYLLQLALDYSEFLGLNKTNYGDLFCKAFSADYNPDIDYRSLFRPDSFEIGAPLSMLYWGTKSKAFTAQIEDEYRQPRICTTETLMVGGDLDIANPVDTTLKKLIPYMSNGQQVILTHMAHCGDMYNLQPEAFKYMVCRYFDEGIVDTTKFQTDPVVFKPKRSFNSMAKWLYPVVFVMAVLD